MCIDTTLEDRLTDAQLTLLGSTENACKATHTPLTQSAIKDMCERWEYEIAEVLASHPNIEAGLYVYLTDFTNKLYNWDMFNVLVEVGLISDSQ
jgi:hypothetical protein